MKRFGCDASKIESADSAKDARNERCSSLLQLIWALPFTPKEILITRDWPLKSVRLRLLSLAMVLLLSVATPAQPIPGAEGWLLTPGQNYKRVPQKMSDIDVALVRCYRAAIATGQFFLGDVNYVLGRCRQPLALWTAACEHREGKGAAICLLGPQQAVGETLRDAWPHRDDLKSWLASQPPLPSDGPGPNRRSDNAVGGRR